MKVTLATAGRDARARTMMWWRPRGTRVPAMLTHMKANWHKS